MTTLNFLKGIEKREVKNNVQRKIRLRKKQLKLLKQLVQSVKVDIRFGEEVLKNKRTIEEFTEKCNKTGDFVLKLFGVQERTPKGYCEKCGKRLPISVIWYQRHRYDLCKCK
jgi:uncharacterized protein YeeX (DUF496 family)